MHFQCWCSAGAGGGGCLGCWDSGMVKANILMVNFGTGLSSLVELVHTGSLQYGDAQYIPAILDVHACTVCGLCQSNLRCWNLEYSIVNIKFNFGTEQPSLAALAPGN